MNTKKQLKVDPIKNGTVIDHITAGKALQVADILKLNLPTDEVMIGLNLASKKTTKKDIIKIENRELSADEVNSIALIAPEATYIIIKDYKVVNKTRVTIPEFIEDLVVCPNTKCVTNTEDYISSKFKLTSANQPAQIRCIYCEKKYSVDELEFKKLGYV